MAQHRLPESFEVEIETLGPGGTGVGVAPDGARLQVKPGPPGSRLKVLPLSFRKETWQVRRLEMLRRPPDYVTPPCAIFGLCGGCSLQEMSLEAQRAQKLEFALSQVAAPLELSTETLRSSVRVHAIRGSSDAYHYRNKVELTFGNWRFVSEADKALDLPLYGRFMGFHAPGRFDRVVDTPRCWLVGDAMNALIGTLRHTVLDGSTRAMWDPRRHTGFWRHALLREGQGTGELMVGIYTTSGNAHESANQALELERVAQALLETRLPDGKTLVGVAWIVNDQVADVAQGLPHRVWGRAWIEERLGECRYRLSIPAFFQTSTPGARVLYDTLAEALEHPRARLYDLYCGTGAIGIYLNKFADEIIGIEEVEQAVLDARANAERNGLTHARYQASKMEDALEVLDADLHNAALVVDPPRAGLHPRVAQRLASCSSDVLIYVACNPASLGRDARVFEAGGWRLDSLWSVDLFPQTGHLELVGRFVPR